MPGRRSRLAIRPNIGPKASKQKADDQTPAASVEAESTPVVEEETPSTAAAVSEPLKSHEKPEEPAPKPTTTGRRQKFKPTVSIKRKSRSESKVVAEDEGKSAEAATVDPEPLVEPTPDPVDVEEDIVAEVLPKSPKTTAPVCPASPVKRIPRPSTPVAASIRENDENVPAPNIPAPNRPSEPQVPAKPRRKLVKIDEPVDRAKMTMKDFIYMNPTNNPMKSPSKKNQRRISVVVVEDDPCPAKLEEDSALPAPQVTIGPDGCIVLNEQSVIIPTEKRAVELEDLEVVDETDAVACVGRYRHRPRQKAWTMKETMKFYVALSNVGTDFTSMSTLFPKRTRAELKKKFNKEDKLHRDMVEKALNRLGGFSLDLLNEPESEEEPQEKKKAPKKRKPKEQKEVEVKPPRPKRKKRKSMYYEVSSSDEDICEATPVEVSPSNIRTRSSSDPTQPPSKNGEEIPPPPTSPLQHSPSPSPPVNTAHVVSNQVHVIREEPG